MTTGKPATNGTIRVNRWFGKRLFSLVIVGILTLHVLLLAYGARVHSPTLDEPAHLASGIYHWRYGHFDFYRVNPPLVRLVAALPALASGAELSVVGIDRTPGARSEFELGNRFLERNQKRACWLVTLGRWACIPFSVLGALAIYLWGRECFGERAALFGLTLWCFEPNIIGHGQLFTPDVPAASLAVTAAYAFWRWLDQSSMRRAVIAGVMLGIAQLSRTTLIVLFPVWIVVWLAYRTSAWKAHGMRGLAGDFAMIGVQIFIALWLINAGYLFDGSFTKLGNMPFISDAFVGRGTSSASESRPTKIFGLTVGNRFEKQWLGAIPVPLPADYVRGIDEQCRDFEYLGRPSFLRGEWRDHGWWYYYLYALAIKMPIGMLILLAISAFISRSDSCSSRDKVAILLPAFALLTFVSSQTGFSHHMRYVLVIFPFLCLWVSQLANLISATRKATSVAIVVAATLTIVSSLWSYPHSLSYFNEFVGGPANGHNHLIHSNLDWGQDLIYLRRWETNHPEVSELGIAYYGSINPGFVGLEYYVPSRRSIPDGVPKSADSRDRYSAVSVNLLKGYPCTVQQPDGSRDTCALNDFAYFQDYSPVAHVGYSILVYRNTR